MNKVKKVLLAVFMCICGAVFLYSGYRVADALIAYKKADDFYSDLSERYISRRSPESTVVPTSESFTDESDGSEDSVGIDFARLVSDYPDIVGWLRCDGTVMDYPVVKYSDNDYYLRRDLNGQYLVTGTIFADFRCTRAGEDICYMIFGHNMNNGTIFGMLKTFCDPGYLAKHPTYTYLTPNGDIKVEVLAAAETTTDDPIYNIGSGDGEAAERIRVLCASAGYEMTVSDDDRFVVLSTCVDDNSNRRLLLIGRVTKAGDTVE